MKSKTKLKRKRRIEPIPDTPENVAKALFGIKLTSRKSKPDKESNGK